MQGFPVGSRLGDGGGRRRRPALLGPDLCERLGGGAARLPLPPQPDPGVFPLPRSGLSGARPSVPAASGLLAANPAVGLLALLLFINILRVR